MTAVKTAPATAAARGERSPTGRPPARRNASRTGARSPGTRSTGRASARPDRAAKAAAPKRRAPSTRPTLKARRPVVAVLGGVVWTVVLLVALGLPVAATVVVMVPVAAVASASGVKAVEGLGRRSGRRGAKARRAVSVRTAVALAGSVLVPIAALGGPAPAVAALAVFLAGALLLGSASPRRLASAVVAVGPAAAAMSMVLARHQGSNYAMALAAGCLAYDGGAFAMGNSRTPSGGPLGIIFGLVSLAVVAVFVAAMMNPPFSGVRPWVVYGVVGVLAAAGVGACERAVPGARSPALLRLDSLIFAGPAWVIAVAVLGGH